MKAEAKVAFYVSAVTKLPIPFGSWPTFCLFNISLFT